MPPRIFAYSLTVPLGWVVGCDAGGTSASMLEAGCLWRLAEGREKTGGNRGNGQSKRKTSAEF